MTNKLKRIFPRNNYSTGVVEWFFKSREGLMGPFNSEDAAVWALEEYLQEIARAKEISAAAEAEAFASEASATQFKDSRQSFRLN